MTDKKINNYVSIVVVIIIIIIIVDMLYIRDLSFLSPPGAKRIIYIYI